MGNPSSAAMMRVLRAGSVPSRSPTAQTIARPGATTTSAKAERSARMSSSRRGSSIVTETLTSEVVTTSTAVR